MAQNENPVQPARGKGDLGGGVSAMLVALPSSIAYGVTTVAVLGPAYLAQGALAGVISAVMISGGLILAAFLCGLPLIALVPTLAITGILIVLGGRRGRYRYATLRPVQRALRIADQVPSGAGVEILCQPCSEMALSFRYSICEHSELHES